MTGQKRSNLAIRFLTIVISAVAATPVASAASYYTYGSNPVTEFMNLYFLPANAQVTGLSGLIFGVILPFSIVLILLYMGLDRAIGGREAKALAVLLSLFIIPSGGYRFISSMLLTVFGLGNMSTSVGGVNPMFLRQIIGTKVNVPLLGSLATVVGLTYLFHKQPEDFGGWEYLVTAGAGIAAYFILGGDLTVVWTMVGYAILFWLGFEIFQRGLGTNRISGSIVGLLGIAIIGFAVMTASFLPGNIQGIGGLIAFIGFFGIIILVAILAVAAYILIVQPDKVFDLIGG
ncbi:MAG: hypothetical protein ABEJ83_04540 [Candidatus Nanohaloarchaea archaeon]